MPRRNSVLLRATTEGAGPVAAEFDRDARRAQDETIRELRQLARIASRMFREFAPEDSGRLRDSIEAVPYFGVASEPRFTVRAYVRDPVSGFDYLPITRFGHRGFAIFPKRGRALAVHYAGRDKSGDGPVVFRPYVRAYHPDSDWAEDAGHALEPAFVDAERRLGRRIVRA